MTVMQPTHYADESCLILCIGKTWAYTIGIIATAYIGKMAGGVAGAKAAGYTWREAATVGTLLSCKG